MKAKEGITEKARGVGSRGFVRECATQEGWQARTGKARGRDSRETQSTHSRI